MQILICPFCGNELTEDRNYCCGEAGHGEWVLVCDLCEEQEVKENEPLCQLCKGYDRD